MNSGFYINNPFSRFLEIRGEDRADFLQGLITNDIYKCKNDKPIYSCLLSPQGKFLADFFILLKSNSYLIEIHKKFFSSFLSNLETYKLRSNVEFIKNEDITSIILFSDKDYKVPNTILKFNDPRNKNIGDKIFINDKNSLKIDSLDEMPFDKYKEILIKNFIPFCPIDLDINKSLLLENNFEKLGAIDWDKGCYVGQEITARMKYRSLLKKKLYLLEIISGEIKIGEVIKENNITFGKIVSKVNKYILCMLKIELTKEKQNNKAIIKLNSSTKLKFL